MTRKENRPLDMSRLKAHLSKIEHGHRCSAKAMTVGPIAQTASLKFSSFISRLRRRIAQERIKTKDDLLIFLDYKETQMRRLSVLRFIIEDGEIEIGIKYANHVRTLSRRVRSGEFDKKTRAEMREHYDKHKDDNLNALIARAKEKGFI